MGNLVSLSDIYNVRNVCTILKLSVPQTSNESVDGILILCKSMIELLSDIAAIQIIWWLKKYSSWKYLLDFNDSLPIFLLSWLSSVIIHALNMLYTCFRGGLTQQ